MLDNAPRHLRHALRCTGLALPLIDDDAQARCAVLTSDIAAAARETAGLLDQLDGGHP